MKYMTSERSLIILAQQAIDNRENDLSSAISSLLTISLIILRECESPVVIRSIYIEKLKNYYCGKAMY